MTRTTYTYAVLEVSPSVYGAVRALLMAANYDHAVHQDSEEGEVIDMHGIALKARGGSRNTEVVVSSLLSSRTREGMVELQLNGEMTQMDLAKAREIVGMLQQGIEAAMTDQILFQFLIDRVGLTPEKAGAALGDFREMRQGSRGIVRPN